MRVFRNLGIAPVAAVAALSLASCGKSGSEPGDMTLGNPQAPVTMVEYASVACPHCAAFNNTVWPDFKAKYVDTGQVYYVMREQMTGNATLAAAGFRLARCAGPDKYFTVTDYIYHNQALIMQDLRNNLLNLAKSVGMTEDGFDKCLTDDKALKELNDRTLKIGRKYGISGTPAFFMNGKKVAESEVTLEQLDKAVADAKAGK